MDQRTKQWLDWRLGGIGSSDAPIIMGVSPWKTPYQLWEEKTGRVKNDHETNFAQQRGNDLEPKARALYELGADIDMPAILKQHATLPMLRASMDGGNDEKKAGLEIKCPGKADHEKALAGNIPEKYFPQLQHQFLCTGYEWIDYYSFDGVNGVTVRAYPDKEYLEKLLKAEMKFWDYVIQDKAPPLTEKDYTNIRSLAFKELAIEFRAVDQQMDGLEAKRKELKAKILQMTDHNRAIGYGVRIIRSKRKGNIDYSKIPELQNVDLEKFRKEMIEVETVECIDE